MLDAEAVKDYEHWKMKKLTAGVDLSVQAYNLDMESTALAYEAGVKAVASRIGYATGDTSVDEVLADNPYRKPGMNGEPSATRKVTS